MKLSTSPVSCAQLLERFPELILEASGDPSVRFTRVSSPEIAGADSIVFVNTARALTKALATKAPVIAVGKREKKLTENAAGKTILICSNVELAMARTIQTFFLGTPYTNSSISGIHPTATIQPGARLGSGARIGPYAFIGADVKIGARTYVGANSVIEDGTEIGEDSVIHPLVFIGHTCSIGNRCEIHPTATIGKEGFGYAHDEKGNHYRIPHIGRVILEDDVHIGAGCTLDRGTFEDTRIGAGSKLDNHCHFGHNSTLGRNGLVTEGFSVAGSTKIGANFVAGGHAGVTGHIEICDGVQIGGLSGVTKAITKSGAYSGYPLQPLQQFLRTKAAVVQLPKMRRQLGQIMKNLGLTEEDIDSSET